MIIYHFILIQCGIKYKIWSKNLIQFHLWNEDKALKISNISLIKDTLDDEKLSLGYYFKKIK